MEQCGLVEVHQAAVVLHLLPLVLLGRVEAVVAGLDGGAGPVQGLHDGPLVTNLHYPAQDKAGPWVSQPDLVSVHLSLTDFSLQERNFLLNKVGYNCNLLIFSI